MTKRSVDLEILRRMTPQRKLTVMNGMIRQAWELKAAGIRLLHPKLAEDEVRAMARAAVAGERT